MCPYTVNDRFTYAKPTSGVSSIMLPHSSGFLTQSTPCSSGDTHRESVTSGSVFRHRRSATLIVLFALVSLLANSAFGQTINTVAGSTKGYGGDGGPATGAQLNSPTGVAIDVVGNIYIADRENSRVRKVSSSGIMTTIAGDGTLGFSGDGGPAILAKLNVPTALTVDSLGNVYIADQVNERVRKVSVSGIITTVAGNGVQGFSGDNGLATSAKLYSPIGVALDAQQNLYIADAGNNRIRKVSSSGIITTIAGNGETGFSGDGGPAVNAAIYNPNAVATGWCLNPS